MEPSSESSRREVELPTHDAWTFDDSYPVTASSRTRVIALAGAPNCGKTTLIASLLHRFMRGPFAGFHFAGSRTLKGFDQRCYLARTVANAAEADTPRTSQGTARNLLHLRLRSVEQGEPRDILFLDVSGEDFREATKSLAEAKRLTYLRRADRLVILLDGARLADNSSRHLGTHNATMLLQSLCDASQVHIGSRVHLVVTKWDEVATCGSRAETEEFVDDATSRMVLRFGPRVREFTAHKVAARAKDLDNFPLAHGMEDLLARWAEDVAGVMPVRPMPHAPPSCEFDRIALRTV